MKHSETAVELFAQGCNCSQAVFCAYCDVTGFDLQTSLKLSSAFGGGMGRMREVCGVCSGVFMVLGMLYGENVDKDYEAKKNLYELVQDFSGRFKEINKTIICKELLVNIKTDTRPIPTPRNAEFMKIRPCVRYVADACNILDIMLGELN